MEESDDDSGRNKRDETSNQPTKSSERKHEVDDMEKKRTRRSMKKKNMLTNFKIMFNNMRGYKMKKETLTHIINEERPVVLGIAETNLERKKSLRR